MRISLFDDPSVLSMRVCIENLARELESLGVELCRFRPGEPAPRGVDLHWDPRGAGGAPPPAALRYSDRPVVANVYGVAPLGIAPWEYFDSVSQAARTYRFMFGRIREWHRHWRGRCAAIVTPSAHSAREVRRKLLLGGANIVTVPLGVDSRRFYPGPREERETSYLLHVSAFQAKKNTARILAAYRLLDPATRPPLILHSVGHPAVPAVPGVEIRRDPVPDEALALLVRKSRLLIFPSLHEGFGLPILEAMASGVPVVTSNGTACGETAGGAAALVNPRSVPELAAAIRRLLPPDSAEAAELIERGLARARALDWETSARGHLAVFRSALGEANEITRHAPRPLPQPA